MKRKIRIIAIRVVLGFLAINALLILVGLVWPLTHVDAYGAKYPETLSLLGYDESREPEIYQIEEIASDLVEDVAEYGKAYKWEEYNGVDAISFTLGSDFESDNYEIAVDYYSLQTNVTSISISILVNGNPVIDSKNAQLDSENMVLPTYWTDETYWMQEDGKEFEYIKNYDIYNNQVTSTQIPYRVWNKTFLYDQRYYGETPLRFAFKAGDVITIKRNQGNFYLGDIYLFKAEEAKSYDEVSSTGSLSGDKIITIEGETPLYKSDASIQAGAVQNPGMYPYSTSKNMLNVLSGDSFNKSGYSVTYSFEVEEEGYYAFTLKYANTQSNTNSYLDIYVDNVSLYEEFIRYPFAATSKYKNETIKSNNGENVYVKLAKGVHTITLRVDASLQSEIYFEMSNIINEISELYLEIIKLTGGENDPDRNWDIKKHISTAETRVNDWIDRLARLMELSGQISKVDAEKDNNLTQYINNARNKLIKIAKDVNKLPHQLANLCTGTASASTLLSNSLHTSTFSPVSIDRIYVHQADAKLPKASNNFFLGYFSTVQRVVRSGVNIADGEDVLTVWVNRSTYYVSSMQKFVDANYTGKVSDTKVRFSILPDESKLTYAYAAGTQPDMALGVSSSTPYDLGLRGALEDLTQFVGFEKTIVDLAPGALVNMGYNGKIFGLPETQDFQILYYRTDLLDSFGIEVPNTWGDVIEMLPELQCYGMNFYIPMAGGSGLKSISQTSSFIFQYGGSLYNDDFMSSAIDDKRSIAAVNLMVDLFQLYSLPLTSQNFYDSFRNGTIPAGVANFDIYLQLANAAPEIEGKWAVALHPGIEQEDGTINRTAAGDTRNGVIFKKTKEGHAQMAWNFMSWWLSAEAQAGFANAIQSTYGSTFLWNTANLEAFKTLAMPEEIKTVVLEQLQHLHNVPQIPATYIVERGISNIWNKAIFDNASVRALITDGKVEMDKEIKRKMEEFGFVNAAVNKYDVFTVEEIKALQAEGRKQMAIEGGSN